MSNDRLANSLEEMERQHATSLQALTHAHSETVKYLREENKSLNEQIIEMHNDRNGL